MPIQQRLTLLAVLVFCAIAVALAPSVQARLSFQPVRFRFDFDAKTPLSQLMPPPPRSVVPPQAALLPEELEQVPELHLQEPVLLDLTLEKLENMSAEEVDKLLVLKGELMKKTAHQMAKINFLNRTKTDRFIELLMETRPDLAGLPFILGAEARQSHDQSLLFFEEVGFLHSALAAARQDDPEKSDLWKHYEAKAKQGGAERVAALMQVLTIAEVKWQRGLPSHLASQNHERAGAALARLAIFSPEESVRSAALAALQKRPASESTAILREGLAYPWPAVAERSAQAIAKLQRRDLLPDLTHMRDAPDPRAPVVREMGGVKQVVVRELVRINHHRNCLLCHPPGNTPDVEGNRDIAAGAVPTPGETLPPASAGYLRAISPDIVVRADITYLRQDFSLLQKVARSAPWPVLQRFDFVVRTRTLNHQETADYQAAFSGRTSNAPYRDAAAAAIRELEAPRTANPSGAAP